MTLDALDLTSGSFNTQALIRWTGHEPDWQGYAIGYRRAAEALVETVATDGVHVDTLVFPVVGLYRHAIELHLKWVAVVLRDELRHGTRLIATHDILRLWRHLERPLRELGLDGAEWERVDAGVRVFARMDPRGVGFRYPICTDGTSSLTMETLNLVVVASLADVILEALRVSIDCAKDEVRLRAQEAMSEDAQEWWYSLGEEERAGYERAHAELYEAYLAGEIP